MAKVKISTHALKIALKTKMLKQEEDYKEEKQQYIQDGAEFYNFITTPFRFLGICKLRTFEEQKAILDSCNEGYYSYTYEKEVPNTYEYEKLEQFLKLCDCGSETVTLSEKDVKIIF